MSTIALCFDSMKIQQLDSCGGSSEPYCQIWRRATLTSDRPARLQAPGRKENLRTCARAAGPASFYLSLPVHGSESCPRSMSISCWFI
jgi:hypothetical protein